MTFAVNISSLNFFKKKSPRIANVYGFKAKANQKR